MIKTGFPGQFFRAGIMVRLNVADIPHLILKPDADLVKRLPCGKCLPTYKSSIKGGVRTGTVFKDVDASFRG